MVRILTASLYVRFFQLIPSMCSALCIENVNFTFGCRCTSVRCISVAMAKCMRYVGVSEIVEVICDSDSEECVLFQMTLILKLLLIIR